MNDRRVPPSISLSEPRVARAYADAHVGPRLRAWIVAGEARFTDVARCLGVSRARLYEVLDGQRKAPMAWLWTMPPAVLRVALWELAESIGYELTPLAELGDDHCDHRQLADVIRELADVQVAASAAHATGYLDPARAREELREIAEAEKVLAERKARLRQVIEGRGCRLTPVKEA